MKPSAHKIEISELLSHGEWVRRVARSLVTSSAAADDVVQNTWVAALEKPPGTARTCGAGWGVSYGTRPARSVAAKHAGHQREQHVARPEAVSSVKELTELATLQREVVGHVLALEEPFRSVVLLRFFEDLDPPQIAERLGTPLKTVHSRLQRAFQKLRTRLEGNYGSERSWCNALAPLASVSELQQGATSIGIANALKLSAGPWLMGTNAKLAAATAVVLLGGAGLWHFVISDPDNQSLEPDTNPALAQVSDVAQLSPDAETQDPVEALGDQGRRAALPTGTTIEEPLAEVPAAVQVHGRALDLQGAALEGVSIVLASEPGLPLAVTQADGSFELEWTGVSTSVWGGAGLDSCLRVEDPDWIAVQQSCVRESNTTLEHIVVAAPRTSLEGWIEDVEGLPIQDVQLSLRAKGATFVDFPRALDMTSFVPRTAQSDQAGRFHFDQLPRARGLQLNVLAKGYLGKNIDLDSTPRPLVIQLAQTAQADQVFLEGFVLDTRGFAAEDAMVRLASASVQSDRTGYFRIPVGRVAATTPLCAVKQGSLPALIANFGEVIEQQGGRPEPVELVLGEEPLEIAGVVVDETGAACVGWEVSVVDATAVSQFRHPVDSAEDLVRGTAQNVTTDEAGSFRLTGLLPRDYTVMAYERETLFRVEAIVRAGDEHALLQASRARRDLLTGRVVSRSNVPMAGVRVSVALITSRSAVGNSSVQGPEQVTDASGTFRFEQIPAENVYLSYSGEEVLPGRVEIDASGHGNPMEIEVTQRCHFRIEGPEEARYIEFFDADGKRLQISRFEAFGMSASMRGELDSGKTEVLSVSELATTLVLSTDAGELDRQEIQLDPDEINVLRF